MLKILGRQQLNVFSCLILLSFKDFLSDILSVICIFLLQFDGMKDLVLDEELMKPLDIIAGISFFRVCEIFYNSHRAWFGS